MIPIPEELAKRVLEALEEFASDASVDFDDMLAMYGGAHWRTARARRALDDAEAIHDELAALLTPKEAT